MHSRFLKILILLSLSLGSQVVLAADRPNIIFMLSDDQAWSGTSVAMHPTVHESKSKIYSTNNLEKLASQGMRFSQGYAPAPVCSPTRISLQTGKSPAQLHWTKASPAVEGMRLSEPKLIKNIAADEVTIAELLRTAGYATAHYGKWHIGGGGPGSHGYDEHDGDTGNENAFKFHDPNPVDIFGMAERAKEFMAKAKQANKPFFIQLSWNALHASENASKAALAKYQSLMSGANEKAIGIAAITEDLDRGVGVVLDAVEKLGLVDSTYVIYMADNGAGGGERKNGLRGGKGGVWEGGIRVPLIVRGPGVAPDSWCHVPVVGYDFYPTFCEWAGVKKELIPTTVEGGSMHPLLTQNPQAGVQRKFPGLAFHFPHYQSDEPQSSLLVGSLKLVHLYESNQDQLFDLSKDLGERNDISANMPKETTALKLQLEKYLTAVNAQLPQPNPNFNTKPNSGSEETRGKRNQNKRVKKAGN